MLRTFAQILGFALVMVIPIGASDKHTQALSKEQRIQVTSPPHGDSSSLTKQLNCENFNSTREKKDCFNKTYKQADQRLAQVSSRLIAFFELDKSRAAERKRRLSRAEEAWIKFRDTNCELRSSGRDNEERAVFQESCRARMTQERAQELEEFLQKGG